MCEHVNRYCEIDFDPNGEAARELMQAVEREAEERHLRLSDHLDPVPTHLTAEMATWFRSHVEPYRHAALAGIDNLLGQIDRGRHGAPVFMERDTDNARRRMLESKRRKVTELREENRTAHAHLDQLRQDEQEARSRFVSLRAQHNREPKMVNGFVYVAVLILIGLAEAAINWESFNAIDFFTPAIATGTTFVVALALAYSSHLFGTTIRQWKALFSPSVDDIDRAAGWKMLGLGSLALTVALGAVAYGRMIFLADVVVTRGFGGEAPSALKIVGGSMLTNLLVWLVGILVAYLMHDPDPRYPEARKELDRAERARKKLEVALDGKHRRSFERADAEFDKRCRELEQSHHALAAVDTQVQARNLIERVKATDARVLALLARYRQSLVRALPAEAQLQARDETYSDRMIQIAPHDYAAIDLRMKYV